MTAGQDGAAEVRRHRGYILHPHAVEGRIGAAEVRRNAPRLLVAMDVTAPAEGATAAAFGRLAGYIGGANAAGARIAMTTPVLRLPGPAPDRWTVAFVLPQGMEAGAVPARRDPALRIVAVPEERRIVMGLPGRPVQAAVARVAAELAALAGGAGLVTAGEPVLAIYDSPMTPDALRHNEVSFLLA